MSEESVVSPCRSETSAPGAHNVAEGVASPRRRSLLALSAAAGLGGLALGAAGVGPARADILRSVKGLFDLDPLVVNFAFEMEELESEFFLRVLRSPVYNSLSPRERNAFNLIATQDRAHFEMLNDFRGRTANRGGGRFETPNASASRRPGNFYYPSEAFKSRDKLYPTALDIKETVLFAYHGAVDLVAKDTLKMAAAIAGVEGRHLAVLREMSGIDPVPSPFEGALQSGAAGNRLARYGFNGGGYGIKGGTR